jgi:hypothetical protein
METRLSELLELLKRAGLNKEDSTSKSEKGYYGYLSRSMHSKVKPLEAPERGHHYPDHTTSESEEGDFMSYLPPLEDPWTFSTERLYTFPESDFMSSLILRDFIDPRPFHRSMMNDIPTDDSPLYKWFLVAMEEQWSRTCSTMFASDWDGLPELFTKKVTKFVAGLRFACPSAYFDRFFGRYWDWGTHAMDESEHDSMEDQFYEFLGKIFKDFPEDSVRSMAHNATWTVHWEVMGDMTKYMFGDAYRDVAMFSWQFWTETWRYFNTTTFTGTPTNMDFKPISDFFWYAWRESGVHCESGPTVLARYINRIHGAKSMLERPTIEEVTGNIMSKLAYEYGYDITDSEGLDVIAIANTIQTYIKVWIDFLDKQEPYFVSNGDGNVQPDMMKLYNVFLQFEDVPGFVWEMFRRLDYVSGPIPDNN